MTYVELNCYCYIEILETIKMCTKRMNSGSFKNVIYKMFTNHNYFIYFDSSSDLKYPQYFLYVLGGRFKETPNNDF